MSRNLILVVSLLAVTSLGCGGKPSAPATVPTAAPALNGCSTFKDMTEAGASAITWDPSIASSELRCVKIKVNQTVGFAGNFTTHPMAASGGATPSPFSDLAAAISNPGTDQEGANFAFPTAGTYGFVCGVHPAMTGAVLVVE